MIWFYRITSRKLYCHLIYNSFLLPGETHERAAITNIIETDDSDNVDHSFVYSRIRYSREYILFMVSTNLNKWIDEIRSATKSEDKEIDIERNKFFSLKRRAANQVAAWCYVHSSVKLTTEEMIRDHINGGSGKTACERHLYQCSICKRSFAHRVSCLRHINTAKKKKESEKVNNS